MAPEGKTEEKAMELAKVIAGKPFEAIKLIRKGVREMWQKTTAETFVRIWNLVVPYSRHQTAQKE